MIVEVRPIERQKWHGKEGKENFSQPVTLECLYDTSTGKYATGLNEEERKSLEAKTGYDLSDAFNATQPHPFWSSSAAKIKLPARTVIFNTDKPLDFIKVRVLKASKYVANSMKEYEEGLFPEATHVIFDEAEDMKIKASKIQRKNKATAIAMKLSSDQKANIIQILSMKSMKNQSQDFLDVEIDKIIEDQLDEFLKYASMDKEKVYLRAAILEGIHKNVLTKDGSAIYFMGDQIGFDLEDAVKYFSDPNNQRIKAAILEKITA